ncbi:MAG: lysophospholipid acyltransferase family protein [Arhodomonas sp.]|nr:lysophospholipid acyltransferase family protein [Arhodomonas sp.]
MSRGSWFRGAVFQAGFVALVLLWGIPSLFTAVLPYRWRYWFISRWCVLVEVWLRLSAGIRHRIKGRENTQGPAAVVMAKHQSTWETRHLGPPVLPQSWVVKRELIWVPVFGWALGLLRPIAIDRAAGRNAVREVIRQGRERLAAGRWVVVYPEGTRVPAGRKGRYRLGGAILAARRGYPWYRWPTTPGNTCRVTACGWFRA